MKRGLFGLLTLGVSELIAYLRRRKKDRASEEKTPPKGHRRRKTDRERDAEEVAENDE